MTTQTGSDWFGAPLLGIVKCCFILSACMSATLLQWQNTAASSEANSKSQTINKFNSSAETGKLLAGESFTLLHSEAVQCFIQPATSDCLFLVRGFQIQDVSPFLLVFVFFVPQKRDS
uniref:Uncharacterized protein n=2 Tax=Micrurus TaxID=8634 RepID=A0A2D4NE21_9SAUR